MSRRAIDAVRAAREVAEFLDSIGEKKRANDVRRVCRSNDCYRGTLQVLHRDNMTLRAQAEGAEAAVMKRPSDAVRAETCPVCKGPTPIAHRPCSFECVTAAEHEPIAFPPGLSFKPVESSSYYTVRRHRGGWAVTVVTACIGGDLRTSLEIFGSRDDAINRGREIAESMKRVFREPRAVR